MSARARSAVIFAFEVALVVGYVVAFAVFVTQSEDFIFVRNNTRANQAATAAASSPPDAFEFGLNGNANVLLGAGWHNPNEDRPGAWSKALGYVFLPVAPSQTDLKLSLDGRAYVAPGHEVVDVALAVDGTEMARWTARLGEPERRIDVTVPASMTTDGLLELHIDASPMAVPYHYDRSGEKRKVGYLLRAIHVEHT